MPGVPPEENRLQVKQVFAKNGVHIKKHKIDAKINELQRHGIPQVEILRNTIRFFSKKHDVDAKKITSDPYVHFTRSIGYLRNREVSTVRARLVKLWEPSCEKVAQTGIIGDRTGTTKFMISGSASVPTLIEGKSYEFKNVIAIPWMGQFAVYANKNSQIREIQEDIEFVETVKITDGRIKIDSKNLHQGKL